MDPNKKVLNGVQEPFTETGVDEKEIENQNIFVAGVASEPHIPDVAGLNIDTSFVNTVDDVEEPED